MSTREKQAIRQRPLELGVSQISAGSRTNPGGYQESSQFEAAQFQLGDHRSLAEVIADLGQHKFIPSFCTGCYRLGRTGKDFMGLAKPGLIKEKCAPNALSTFEEYLLDYGTPEAREAGGAQHCGGVGRYGRQDPQGFRKPRQGAGRPQGRLLLGTFLQ